MMIAKTTAYGIRALAYLAKQEPGRPCELRKIAEGEQIPPVYLRKILSQLRRHRLVHSTKGIHGGYQLSKPPETIILWDVFRVLDPEPDVDMCVLGHGVCDPRYPCPLHEDWEQLRRQFIELLQSRTISEVADRMLPRIGREATSR